MPQKPHLFNTVDLLKLCLELDAFQICRPIHVDDLIKHAKERGVDVDRETLQRLDQLGLFRPMFYCIYPVARYKKEPIDGSQTQYRRGALLIEEDDWDGPVSEEPIYPSFTFRDYMTWYKSGNLRSRNEFVPWDELMPMRNRRESGKAYYSIFQVADLYQLLMPMTLRDKAIWLFELSCVFRRMSTTHSDRSRPHVPT